MIDWPDALEVPEEGPETMVPMRCPSCGHRAQWRASAAMLRHEWCACCGNHVMEFDAAAGASEG